VYVSGSGTSGRDGLICGHGFAFGPGGVKCGLTQGRPGAGEARLSLLGRHLVQEGTQRAGPRTVGFADGQKSNSLSVLTPADLQLSDEAKPIA